MATTAAAKTYYAGAGGANGNDGLSASTAWASIQKGLDALQNPGDTLYILAGTYSPGDDSSVGNGDYWTLQNINGTASANITVSSYNGTVCLDGNESSVSGGFPQAGLKLFSSGWNNYQSTLRALFEIDDCSYLTINGIDTKNSLGEGISIKGSVEGTYSDKYKGASGAGNNAFVSHHITMTSCDIHNTRGRAMQVTNTWDLTIQNCFWSYNGWVKKNGCAGVNVKNSHYIYFDGNVVREGVGEGFVCDSNDFDSSHLYVTNNVMFDLDKSAIYFHGVDYAVATGNLIYRTREDREQQIPWTLAKGIAVNNSECHRTPRRDSTYFCLTGNIILEAEIGISIKSEPEPCVKKKDGVIIEYPGYVEQPISYGYVVGNTVVNSDQVNYRWNSGTLSNCVFKDNISISSRANGHVNTGVRGNVSGVSADYNLYSSTPTIVSKLRGTNDIEGENPQLTSTTPPSKPTPVKADRYYLSPSLGSNYDNAQPYRIASSSPAVGTGVAVSAPSGWNSDTYGDDMSDYIADGYDFTGNGNPTRGGTWDIGAHAYSDDSGAAPTAMITVEGSPDYYVDESISFTGGAAGGAGLPYTFMWDWGDDTNVSTGQYQSKSYSNSGYYTITLTVLDADGISGSTTLNVTITEDVSGGAGAVVVEQVKLNAGDATYAVSGQPKFIFAYGGGGITDGTSVSHGILRMGMWAEDGNQGGTALHLEHGQGTSDVKSNNINNGFLPFLEEDTTNSNDYATIDSVSTSSVATSWPANQALESIVSHNFYGGGVSNATVKFMELGADGSNTSYDGDWNFCIVACSLTSGFGDNYQKGIISLGMAQLNGNQVCYGFRSRDNQPKTDVYALMATDRVAFAPYANDSVYISSWDSSRITFSVTGGDINSGIVIGLMKLNATIVLDSLNVPTGAAAVNTDLGIDAQIAWMWGGLLTETSTTATNSAAAGAFNIISVDDAGADYSVGFSEQHDVTVSDSSSQFSGGGTDDAVILAADGTEDAAGDVSLPANNLTIDWTDTPASAYAYLYCAIETVAGSTGITADFAVRKLYNGTYIGGPFYAGDVLQFIDLSDSPDTINYWYWDFGDDTTIEMQSPEHVYAQKGTYDVVLTVRDDNSGESISDAVPVTILPPRPSIVFTLEDHVGSSDDRTGTDPLSCSIDFSGVTAGTGETITGIDVTITLFEEDDDGDRTLVKYPNVQTDTPLTFTLNDVGTYGFHAAVRYEEAVFSGAISYREVWTVTEVDEKDFVISGYYGPNRCPAGAHTETFYLVNQDGDKWDAGEFASVSWAVYDQGTATWTVYAPGEAEKDITFNAVTEVTTYDIRCSIIMNDEDATLYNVYSYNYLTLYPTSVDVPALTQWMYTVATNALATIYLDDSDTWTANGPPYSSTATHTDVRGYTDDDIVIYENGAKLTPQADMVDLEANAGSYYVTTGTTVIATPSVDQSFSTISGNLRLEFTVDSLPPVNPIRVQFRRVDVDNYWQVRVDADGDLRLFKATDGSSVSKELANNVLSGGELIVVECYGGVIKGFYDGTEAWSHTDSDYSTETTGYIQALNSGVISDLQPNAWLLNVNVHPVSGTVLTNTYTWQYGYAPDIRDYVNIGESVAATGMINPDISESVAIGETITLAGLANPVVSEAVTIGESQSVSVGAEAAFTISVSESVTVGESNNETVV